MSLDGRVKIKERKTREMIHIQKDKNNNLTDNTLRPRNNTYRSERVNSAIVVSPKGGGSLSARGGQPLVLCEQNQEKGYC